MTYKQAKQYAAELREMADFIETHGVKIPDLWMSNYEWVNITASSYNDEGEWTLDEAQTKENIKKVLDAFGSCEKDYRDDRILITKNYECSGNPMFRAEVDRSVACKKVVKGQKVIPATEARIVDDVEWVCDENLSLLKLVNS